MPPATIEGFCEPRFAAVRDAFAENFAERGEIGAGVAVMRDGRPVVDLWGGFADAASGRAWQRDTLVNIFSVGKGLTALCALLLVDRNRLELDAPVCRCWPEFAAGGKERVTLRQLLSHQAGLPAVEPRLAEDALLHWDVMTAALAAQEPWWEPGTRHGYHVNTFGFLVGEVVRRADGRSLGTLLREEIAAPLGADVHIGLAAEHDARVAHFEWLPELAAPTVSDPAMLTREQRMWHHTYFNPPGLSGHGTVNTPAWRRVEIPSTNGHATARGVARIYAALAAGGALEGVHLVDRALLREAATEHVNGPDAVLSDRTTRFGLGFQLPLPERPLGPNPGVFGHFGAGGALGFADPEAGIAFGYVMNRMGPRWQNPTTRALVDALYAAM